MVAKTLPRILLLTGVPGVGKTTVVRGVAQSLAGRRLAGFYTEEIRVDKERRGFRLLGFDGSECVIAHVDFPGRPRVSKYGVDVAAIDRAAAALLTPRAGVELYLVDEIGKMECLSADFVAAMRTLLDTGRIVIATVALKGGGFIDEVRHRRDAELWTITHANRDALPAKVAAWLAARAPQESVTKSNIGQDSQD
jgi:nucleoside-triphosphatase